MNQPHLLVDYHACIIGAGLSPLRGPKPLIRTLVPHKIKSINIINPTKFYPLKFKQKITERNKTMFIFVYFHFHLVSVKKCI